VAANPEIAHDEIELSIVLPCLNEERTVGVCVEQALTFLTEHGIRGEVIVADNGSTDRSAEIASAKGAIVVPVAEKGYGNALRGGFAAARGKYIIMADADESYDLLHLMPFVEKLRQGFDLVMGNRFKGGIKPGAMPWHHKYIGNPILSFIGRLFFHSPARDFHCGLRGFTRSAIERMNLQTTGMELASEIVIKASILGMKVCEVPTTLSPDGRDRPPHLRSFRDGWRHLRFLLIYSPTWLFLYPGIVLSVLGSLVSLALFFGPVNIGFRYIDFHTFIVAGSLVYVGLNSLSFAVITRIYAYQTNLLPHAPRFYSLFRYINLEKGLLLGGSLTLLGISIIIRALTLSSNFQQIGYDASVRLVFGGSLALTSGTQIIFTSFVLSILGMRFSRTIDLKNNFS
jgi:glycosyltransferase involved in cell wall biosynthesis